MMDTFSSIFQIIALMLFALILTVPTAISQIHLYMIDAIVNWQTSFKLHYFFHGDTWGDWRDLKYILEAEEVKNFNIFKVSLEDGIHALKMVLPRFGQFIRLFILQYQKMNNEYANKEC